MCMGGFVNITCFGDTHFRRMNLETESVWRSKHTILHYARRLDTKAIEAGFPDYCMDIDVPDDEWILERKGK
jgi:hypothetical protein